MEIVNHTELPHILELPFEINEANYKILLHTESFIIRASNKDFTIHGEIWFHWLPYPTVYFTGETDDIAPKYFFQKDTDEYFDLIIEGLSIGKFFLQDVSTHDFKKVIVSGKSRGSVVLGD